MLLMNHLAQYSLSIVSSETGTISPGFSWQSFSAIPGDSDIEPRTFSTQGMSFSYSSLKRGHVEVIPLSGLNIPGQGTSGLPMQLSIKGF